MTKTGKSNLQPAFAMEAALEPKEDQDRPRPITATARTDNRSSGFQLLARRDHQSTNVLRFDHFDIAGILSSHLECAGQLTPDIAETQP